MGRSLVIVIKKLLTSLTQDTTLAWYANFQIPTKKLYQHLNVHDMLGLIPGAGSYQRQAHTRGRLIPGACSYLGI